MPRDRVKSVRQQDFPLADWQQIIDVNLTGTFLGMQAGVAPI
jgi:3alpha(or 20beta)-hydroxysteroid dehydrogenase